MRSKGTKTIAENRKARHDYFVLESYEAGIELVGRCVERKPRVPKLLPCKQAKAYSELLRKWLA